MYYVRAVSIICGIAGYNCSETYALKNFNSKKTERMLQEAWLHNLHRGYDAAGFFSVEVETDHILVFKSPGLAPTIFDKEIRDKGILEVAKVFAAHTRAPSPSSGSADHNENNHPIGWDKVWTTHNGTIFNDDTIKELFVPNKIERKQTVPKVDSVAISMMLSDVSPLNFDKVLEALDDITGSMSIHTIWEDYPGYSLIARASTTHPLIIAFNDENNAVFYGSEIESVWHMIHMMGIEANKGWTYKSLNPGNALIVYDGTIISWGSFRTAGWTNVNSARADIIKHRWLPKSKGHKRQLVYATDMEHSFPFKANRTSIYKSSKGDLLYTKQHGFTDQADVKWPARDGLLWESVLSEADEIIQDKEFLYAFYGDIEIVFSKDSRIIKDVYNHALFNNGQRWTNVKKKISEPTILNNIGLDWDKYIFKEMTTIHKVPTSITNYLYVEEIRKFTEAKAADFPKAIMPSTTSAGRSELLPKTSLDMDNFYIITNSHPANRSFAFMNPGLCGVHNSLFKNHSEPMKCLILLESASVTMAAFSGVDIFTCLEDVIVDYIFTDSYCGNENKKEPKDCWWVPDEFIEIFNNIDFWRITTAESCMQCGSVRTVRKMPEWLSFLNSSARLDWSYHNVY